ncbi:aldehyde dehydrogenase (NADP(+)) [Telmatobacter bradus]|uniref:aldehyde dehydrogenase (NADP(+)) n=1 Tax=Telmatobacter bradus TaxID=474953 RepID=UPI003B437B4F
MELTGRSFIGKERGASAAVFYGINPLTGAQLEPGYAEACAEEVERAVQLAAEAAGPFAAASGQQRAALLRRIADKIDAVAEPLIERAHAESGLPLPRLKGETARTTGQLRLFASILEEGSWLRARIDTAQPERKPLSRPALRSLLRPLGPVVVFGASNFPLAFSTAGGDTAAALAAGSPVIVKAHPAHPATSEIVAAAIQQAVAEEGMPAGVFSLLYSAGNELGKTLVLHPLVQAVAFTGSQRGGRALMDLAASRPRPIPCFAEMSSINPLFVLPKFLAADPEGFAQNLFASFTLGSGQFCTKPGIIFWTKMDGAEAFVTRLKKLVDAATPLPLLTAGIAKAYGQLTVERAQQSTREAEAKAAAEAPFCNAAPHLYSTTLAELEKHPTLAEEIFGPTTLLVECPYLASYVRAAAALDGQLTATIFGTDADFAAQQELITVLATKAGRVIANAFPTGVEVSHAMVHGGPYPAASDARFTSVGTRAIDRFVRPVCYQDLPDALLPAELQNANPLGILRLVDGVETRSSL